MGDKSNTLNFDAKGDEQVVQFIRDFFGNARLSQNAKNNEFQRIYRLYRNEMDMSGRDPNRSNIFIPKLYSTVETIVPHYVDALLGVRPYIPIELSSDANADVGDAQTDLLDSFLDDDTFYDHAIKMIRMVTLFGTSFIEALPTYEDKLITRLDIQTSTDLNGNAVPVGIRKVKEIKRFLKLVFRAYAPWEIYKDPFAKSLKDARGIIKFRGFVSKRQIKKMAEQGFFPDFDMDKLDHNFAETEKDNYSQSMAQDIGVPIPVTDDDMGVWLSYESEDRYIDMWNFTVVLRDQDNPYAVSEGGHGAINLTRIVNTDDPNPFSSWYGIGEGKPIEGLAHAINENWNQTFDNHNMINQAVIYYDRDSLAVEQLVMVPGNRIPVDIGAGKSINDVVQERQMNGLTRDHYAIPQQLENTADQTSGIHEITRGESAVGGQTAREAILKRQAGDSRMKLKIKMGEQMGLSDFGMKCIKLIDQFATPDDIVERIGMEKAQLMPTVNPAAMDGGFRMSFKGSSRMADSQIKRQDAKDIYQLMMGNPSVNQEWLASRTLELFEVPDQERRKAVRTDEEAMQIEQQRAAIEAGAAGGSGTRAISDGGTLGSALGQSTSGKDKNEKLGFGI